MEEQVERERYSVGNKMKFYLKSVDLTNKGPQIVVSRSHVEIVKKIFESEIPEIANGAIEIKGLVREAGSRSKVAIVSNDESIDPIGSCVGQRGSRIQTIISELNNEKVDIILWDENPEKFIINSLSPAKVTSVEFKEEGSEKGAIVKVKEDQLSLAIGRGGQNVRLASRLTGWKIDIVSEGGAIVEAEDDATEAVDSSEVSEEVEEGKEE
jgi:N utilization substance protein A